MGIRKEKTEKGNTIKRSRAKKARGSAVAARSPAETPPWLTVVGAQQNNLKKIDVDVPLERFVAVTGVSGSGKSSLVNDIIRETLARDLNGATKVNPGKHQAIGGLDHLDKVIDIDQTPIGRTPRSNPATYIKVFDEIRALYTKLPDAKVRGYKPGRFSFNVATGAKGGGRCEACEGNGSNKLEMDFLADIWVTCPVCQGRRFASETLQIRYRGKNISDVLNMDVQEALEHFATIPKIAGMLTTLHDVGLDYVKLGQSSTTLSGGEAQRIKLARELVKKSTGRTLYLLDEPTTGLHFEDIRRLLGVLHGFVDAGNSVIVIEHNLDVIKTADWVIDLGPDGGGAGGTVVAQGTPEQVAKSRKSFTGIALRQLFERKTEKLKSRPKRMAKSSSAVVSVVGAQQHNLKDINVEFPRGKMTICSGPSGSGKSSLAIDTVYSEGQRRYVESLSAYARQFLSRMQPPKVERVEGLSPAICIEQKNTSKSPRSTVGTITEIYDYMRILWARLGTPHCPKCHLPIGTQSAEEIIDKVMGMEEGARIMLLAPVEPTGQESYQHLLERERLNGYTRARIDGVIHELEGPIDIDKRRSHSVALVVDRVVVRKRSASRIADSVEQALAVGNGVMIVQPMPDSAEEPSARKKKQPQEHRFSQHRSCEQCGESFDELTPHHFSFNARLGWCDACEGLGTQQGASTSAIVVHPTKSIVKGAIGAWPDIDKNRTLHAFVAALADHIGFSPHTAWNKMAETQQLAVLHGCGDEWIEVKVPRGATGKKTQPMRFRWRGFFPAINRATRSSWQYRKRLEDLVTEVACDACAGGRLRPQPAAVQLHGKTMHEVCLWPLGKTADWFQKLKLDARAKRIAGELIHEIRSRLAFLVDVGLDYVSLHRRASTLSGGEAQRIQLASQIGTGLTGVLYVLDEPTIGLHPRDNHRLIGALNRLRNLGNTLLVVEHDRDVIDAADHLLDFGPGAGTFGGTVTASGSPKAIRKKRASLTGSYLAGKKAIPVPTNRREVNGHFLTVRGAREHNLKEIDVSFPIGRFTCVTGVSGSGKSTLVSEILHKALAARIHRARLVAGGHERIDGLEHIDKVINVDQSPIGNSPTSNPATYTGLFDTIRELYAKLPLSKIRGYSQNRFSFNRPGGRCEACEGMGQKCIEMHFLPDVWVECDNCNGSRYVAETLDVTYRGKSIADVLAMHVSEALELFENVPKVARMLKTLDDVGLGYVALGQSAPTLSGGEAQRVKLAGELGRPSTGKTLYILDEPTTGLHFDDLKKLLDVLHRLVDRGNTCICIEHNLDVIKTADWVIEMGPEAGDGGGTVVAEGVPEKIAKTKKSHTGTALKPVLSAGPNEHREPQTLETKAEREAATRPISISDDVKMPWERDGRAWHTVDHLDHKGNPIEWDTDLLVWLVETIESLASFEAADWNHRSRIEIKTAGTQQWFAHILTGSKDLLEVALRVPERTFTESSLSRALPIKTLDERRDLPVYGQWNRVRLRAPQPGWQEVRIHIRDFKDATKAALTRILKKATAAYAAQSKSSEKSTSSPWKADGQEWHLSQKAIHKSHRIRWKPSTLMALIGRFKSIERNLSVSWSNQTAVQLSVGGRSRWVAKIVTNIGKGMRIEMRAPCDLLTPVMVDKLGFDTEIKRHDQYDRVIFWIASLNDNDAKQLRAIWTKCLETNTKKRLQSA